MKKIFWLFICIGITLGLIFGMKNGLSGQNKNLEENIEDSGDSYIHELNIPIMEIDSLNPLLTHNTHVYNLMMLIYEPLVKIGKDGMLEPILATEWAQKDDNGWIIKLRKEAKWHNGNNFTSSDVVFTISQLRDENIDSPYKSNIENILSVETLDEYSVLITLANEDNAFMHKLTFPIIPEYYFKNGDILNSDKNNIPIGTGPYKYISTNSDGNIINLSINKNWWNALENVRLENIYLYKYDTYGEAIKAYKSADVDLIVTTMTDWEKKFGTIGNNVYSFESSIFDAIIPNTKKLSLSDSSVRKAILYAINRENIVADVFNSNATICDFPIHTRSKNYHSIFQSEYSLDIAKQILVNADWQFNKSFWSKNISGNEYKLKFTLLVNSENIEHIAASKIIKEDLAELGIEISIKESKWTDYKKAIADGNFDLALASFDIKNEFTFLEFLKENGSFNYARYSNEKLNEVVKNIENVFSEENVNELESICKTETPYIGLYFRNNTLLTNKSVKGSFEPIWNDPYQNIITWCK